MRERTTLEAKIFKAMDSLEALISHNESDLNTWSENEFSLNLTYADDKVEFSDYLKQVRELVRQETIEKIKTEQK
ncbi:MAG: HD domain-containing protein [Solobacterium sp.]|jgi:putative hydrolase of HD superfamily|nr:HD domain-containing protein [Solobacterium sp.]